MDVSNVDQASSHLLQTGFHQFPWTESGNHELSPGCGKWLSETLELRVPDGLLCKKDIRTTACTAWAIVLAQYTNETDALFGVLSHKKGGRRLMEAIAVDFENTTTVIALSEHIEKQLNNGVKSSTVHCHDGTNLRSYVGFDSDLGANHVDSSPPERSALILWVTFEGQLMSLRSEFDSKVVSQAESKLIMGHFSQAINHVFTCDTVATSINDLNLLTRDDHAKLEEWNSCTIEPVNDLLHSLFRKASQRYAHNSALIHCAQVITYQELDVASDHLACQIMKADSSLGGHVPICFEKSSNMVIAMLAVLKASKSFVPISPMWSKEHKDHVLSALQAKVILVSEAVHDDRLIDLIVPELVVRSVSMEANEMNHTTHVENQTDSSWPAYVIFTSGSTGTPKGVVIEHRNVCTAMIELGNKLGLQQETRMFQYSSFTFDVSVLEIFGTLLVGGCVCIPSETERLNNVPKAIEDMNVNTTIFVPSVLKILRPEQVPTVRKLVVGGEKLTRALVDTWAEKLQLINAYGPTETCVCSVMNLHVSRAAFGDNIGKAVACRVWVASPRNECRLAPVGAVGELWIEGPTVSRGYLNNEMATESSFRPTLPWSDRDSTERAYRTGDLVRYLPDGKLLFLGRKDHQVKLNGRRIDLEEVEGIISESPLITEAAVLLSHIDDLAILAGFLVSKGTSENCEDFCRRITASNHEFVALFDDLSERLPDYMIPEYLISVNSIPKMNSGKADHHRLLAFLKQIRLDQYHPGNGDKNLAEQSPKDSYELMKALWAKSLDVDPSSISVSDRFLHLGGNSIKAMKLVSAARDSGISLAVEKILGNCTIGELTSTADKHQVISKGVKTKFQGQSSSPKIYKPTWIQLVSLTAIKAFPEGNYTRTIIELSGSLDLLRLNQACQSLVQDNEILRTQYTLRNGAIEAIVLDKVEVPLLRFNSRSEALEYWESGPSSCFDRQLVDFSYVVLDEKCTHLAIGLQHAQYDAWTLPLLLGQLQRMYQSSPVSPGPPFSAYAATLPRETNSEAELFWKNQLSGVPMTLLSTKISESDEPDGHFQKTLKVPPSHFTFATTVYAAWALVLSRQANTQQVVFGGAVSGRNIKMEGILEVVGPCINMIPFTTKVSRCATYLEVLKTVRDSMVATVPYEAMPMPDIITRCTNWDPSAIFGSIVQHLDVSFDFTHLTGTESDVELDWKFLEAKKQVGCCRATDIYVFSTPSRKDYVDLQLKFNPSRISPSLAESLFEQLCEHILVASQHPEAKVLNFL
ncbi:hypothetical protein PDE_01077 [Penicillium oxalicum 114-2]|uniref:Carrier domain-containing protein n=1 Tax=Penicillium oxalicum (strain 114-2 / CGMCC 5302) TaxID=933388 RepID=S7ZBS3_PENO1|nr:hypothetical protein PDE_01077 [Penicillium oxalicum 114-2]